MPNYTICLQANNSNTSRETVSSWLVCLPAKCNTHTEYETTSRVRQEFAREMSDCFQSPSPARQSCSNLFCRHPWLLAWPCATRRGLPAARPPTLRVCARAVRATRSPRAQRSLPYGQPPAPGGKGYAAAVIHKGARTLLVPTRN